MNDWLDAVEARSRAQSKYDKKNTVGFYMKLNIHTDADIITLAVKKCNFY